jgi:hypothetical protein
MQGTGKTNPRRGAASVVPESSIFYGCFQLILVPKQPTCIVFYQNLYHHASHEKFTISHRGFFYEKALMIISNIDLTTAPL